MLDRQWRTGGMGGFIAFDFAVAVAVMPAFKVQNARAMLEDLKVIQDTALPILNEKRDD